MVDKEAGVGAKWEVFWNFLGFLFINIEEENGYEEKEEVVEGMNVHLSEDKEVISVCSQQLSIVAIMRLFTVDSADYTQCMQYIKIKIVFLPYLDILAQCKNKLYNVQCCCSELAKLQTNFRDACCGEVWIGEK